MKTCRSGYLPPSSAGGAYDHLSYASAVGTAAAIVSADSSTRITHCHACWGRPHGTGHVIVIVLRPLGSAPGGRSPDER